MTDNKIIESWMNGMTNINSTLLPKDIEVRDLGGLHWMFIPRNNNEIFIERDGRLHIDSILGHLGINGDILKLLILKSGRGNVYQVIIELSINNSWVIPSNGARFKMEEKLICQNQGH